MDLKSTFFVVGSRVIERPAVVVAEYMAGHEISVHTWSHRVSGLVLPMIIERDVTKNVFLVVFSP